MALKTLNCGLLPVYSEPFSTIEEAAARLCVGVTGDQAAWNAAATALAAVPSTSTNDCWSIAAGEVLRNIAAVRNQKPDARLELAPRAGTACLPDLKALEDNEGNSPPGPVCAGDVIILAGTVTGLPTGSVRSVRVGTTTALVSQRQSFTDFNHPFDFYFLAPPLTTGQPTTAEVSVIDADYPVQGSASFEYAADQSTCLQPPGTPQ